MPGRRNIHKIMIQPGISGQIRRLLLAVLFLAGSTLSAGSLNRPGLKAALDKLITSSGLGSGNISVAVYDPSDTTEVYTHHASAAMIPASVQKIHTAIAALHKWGPEYRFRTPVGFQGTVQDSILTGDLVIQASGDPSWVEELYPQGPHLVFESWADSLLAKGIKRIDGNLVVDVSLFPSEEYNPTWDKEDWPNAYAPSVSPFSFNGNMVRYDLKGASVAGKKPSASVKFGYDYYKWQNNTQTSSTKGQASLWIAISADRRSVTLNGKLGPNTEDYLKAAVRDPAKFALQMLVASLRKKGIEISGQAQAVPVTNEVRNVIFLFDNQSPPLKEILSVMLKNSSGFIAETILADLGPGTEAGSDYVMDLAGKIGLADGSCWVADGSGLSRKNRHSATHLGRFLCHALNQPWSIDFLNSLAVPGETGTLEKRFLDFKGKDAILAKTGTLTGVSNLAGFVRAADGQFYVFAIFANNIGSVAQAKKLQESICTTLVGYAGD